VAILQRLMGWASRSAATPLVPNFSSNLVRRISTLRSTRGGSGRRTAIGVVTAAAIVLTGTSTLALRGAAESGASIVSATDEPSTPFRLAPVDLSFLGPDSALTIVVRPREMMKRPELKPIIESFTQPMLAHAAETLGPGPWPAFDATNMDYIAYRIRADEHGNVLGCDVAVGYATPTNVVDWALKVVPNAKLTLADGFSSVSVPQEGKSEPSMKLAQRDERTVIFSDSAPVLRRVATAKASTTGDDEVYDFDAVEGGLAILELRHVNEHGHSIEEFLADMGLYYFSPGDQDVVDLAMRTILNDARTVRAGIDLEAMPTRATVRVAMECEDAPTRQKVQGSIELFQQIAKACEASWQTELLDPATAEAFDEDHRPWIDAMRMGFKAFAEAKFESRDRDNSFNLYFEMSADLPTTMLDALVELEAPTKPLVAERVAGTSQHVDAVVE
jgi:hypothetical protein